MINMLVSTSLDLTWLWNMHIDNNRDQSSNCFIDIRPGIKDHVLFKFLTCIVDHVV